LSVAGRCIVRWSVSKMNLGDVAKEAGVSRATFYLVIPGGGDAPSTKFDAVYTWDYEKAKAGQWNGETDLPWDTEAELRMGDRFLQQEVWERMDADVKKVIPVVFSDSDRKMFGEIGVIRYEKWIDTSEEVDAFAITNELETADAVAPGR
jgi:hypothetical protein